MFRGHSTTPTLILSVVIAAAGATVALFVVPFFATAGSESCDYVVAPNGSDRAAGTVAAPLGTVDELLDRLNQGQTGCLRSGTYVADQFKVSTPAVKLTSYPGERATMRGRLRFNAGADGAVAEGLMLDGRNPGDLLGPLIYADRVVLRNNEITNYNTAICVDISDYPGEREPRGVLIEGNRIHHCGTLPATNHQHGIYVAHARDTVIRNNLIYANADRGIQLYPDADDSLITGNVIEGNGQGVIFGGDDNSSSDRNIVEGNVIANSTIRYNVQSHWQGPTGSGNVARRNCVWLSSSKYGGSPSSSGIQSSMSGASAAQNVVAQPQYSRQTNSDLELELDGKCASVLNSKPGPPLPGPTGEKSTKNGGSAPAPCAPRTGARRDALLVGTRGRDRLVGGPKSEKIRGKGGNDRIRPGRGRDCLLGNRGRDRFNTVDGRRDVVRCGRGRDVAIVDRKDRVRRCERVLRRRP